MSFHPAQSLGLNLVLHILNYQKVCKDLAPKDGQGHPRSLVHPRLIQASDLAAVHNSYHRVYIAFAY